MRTARLVAASVMLVATARCTKTSTEKRLEVVAQSIPWTLKVLERCEAYKRAESDADRTDLANTVASMLKDAEVRGVRGRVEILQPSPRSPDEEVLQIDVADTVKFVSHAGDRAIRKGSPLYDQVVALDRGQCVVFSAKDLAALAPFEMGKVCNLHYYARFESVAPCP